MRSRFIACCLRWAWLLIIVVMTAFACYIVRRCGSHQPFSDEFETPGRILFEMSQGRLSWKELWAWHNEAHLIFPKILWIAQAITVGWSVKSWMYFGVILAGLEAALLSLLAAGATTSQKLKWFTAVTFGLLLLHPCNATGTFLRGSQYIAIMPGFLLVLGCYLHTRTSAIGTKFAIYCVLSLVGTFTFTNGMALWVFLFPFFPTWQIFQSSDHAPRKKTLLYSILSVLLGGLVIASYFIGYGSLHLAPKERNPDPDYVSYFFRWLGAPLALHIDRTHAFAAGVAATLLGAVAVSWLGWTATAKRSLARLIFAWPWLVLMGYGLISAVASSRGRATFLQDQSVAGRYFFISLPYYAGVLGLLLILLRYDAAGQLRTQRLKLALPVYAVFAAFLLFELETWKSGFVQSIQHGRARSREQLALNLWDEAPLIGPIPWNVVPAPASLRTRYLTLIEKKLLIKQGDGIWLQKALRKAQSRKALGEVRLRGSEEKLRVSGKFPKTALANPDPMVLTAAKKSDGTLSPLSVDLLKVDDSRKGEIDHVFSITFRKNRLPPYRADELVFFALDPSHKKACSLQIAAKKARPREVKIDSPPPVP